MFGNGWPVSGSLTIVLPKLPARCSAVGTVAVSVVPTFMLELGHDMAGVPELVRSAIESGA